MRLIDADKLMPINAPIAGIIRGEFTHYEKIVFWKTIYEAPTINVIDRVLEIIHQKGISNAYDRPSFWYNKGKDFKVIDTKYHRGYDQALTDVEEDVLRLLSCKHTYPIALPEPFKEGEE